ncbi:hypothetical protein EMIT0P395_90091 [Pseudomonas sp. IT-P395]
MFGQKRQASADRTLLSRAFSWRYSSEKNRLVIIATASAGDVKAVSISKGASSHGSYS